MKKLLNQDIYVLKQTFISDAGKGGGGGGNILSIPGKSNNFFFQENSNFGFSYMFYTLVQISKKSDRLGNFFSHIALLISS